MDYQTILTHMALFRDYGHRLLHLVHSSDRQSVACCTTQLVSAKQLYLSLCCISLLLPSFSLHLFWKKNRNRTKNWMHQSHCYEITSDYFARNRKSIFTSWVSVKSRGKNTENFVHCFVVLYRKYGSAVSSDQSRTCSLSDVMASNGMNHKNCDSWSRLVVHCSWCTPKLFTEWMSIELTIQFLFDCSRCEQDGRLTRNSSYYGSCVDGIPQRVPCTVERETIAWNGEMKLLIVSKSSSNEIMEKFKWQRKLLTVCLCASWTELHCSLRPFIVLYIIEILYYFVFVWQFILYSWQVTYTTNSQYHICSFTVFNSFFLNFFI